MKTRALVISFCFGLLSLVGAALSLAALYEYERYYFGSTAAPSLCGIISQGFNCLLVVQSKYSAFFGIPLASLGLTFYLAFFVFSIFAADTRLCSFKTSNAVMTFFSTVSFLASIYLFYISKFVIGGLCEFCFAMYGVSLAMFLIAWLAGREDSLFARFFTGFAACFRFIFGLFGLSRDVSAALAWCGLFFTSLIFSVAAYFARDFMLLSYVFPRSKLSETVQELSSYKALDEWRKQTPLAMPVNLSGGALDSDYYHGDVSAKVEIVEFFDYECPRCRGFYFEVEKLLESYGNAVRVVYKNYPLDRSCNSKLTADLHTKACYAAEFSRCAGEQGAFWKVTEYLLRLPEVENVTLEKLQEKLNFEMESLDLDKEGMQECLKSGRQGKKIQLDIEDGAKLGVLGTPTVWINGKKLAGSNLETLKAVIDVALQN